MLTKSKTKDDAEANYSYNSDDAFELLKTTDVLRNKSEGTS